MEAVAEHASERERERGGGGEDKKKGILHTTAKTSHRDYTRVDLGQCAVAFVDLIVLA